MDIHCSSGSKKTKNGDTDGAGVLLQNSNNIISDKILMFIAATNYIQHS